MNRKYLIPGFVMALSAIGLGAYFLWVHSEMTAFQRPPTEREIARQYAEIHGHSGQDEVPAPVAMAPVDMTRPVRLAIGGLGLTDENENQKLGDLVTVQLTGSPGFDLVEREKLSSVLQELNLNWSGFVRAKDAVRAGKLLEADWFLLGTQAKIAGSNSIVVRVVDARTGVLRDAGVFAADKPLEQVAADLVTFLNGSRQNAAHPKPHVFLAIGTFDDVSVNSRQEDFPRQLRSYLTAAYRGSDVTLLEREYVETLLQEVHLDMAGLTEESWSNPPPVMQSAYWLVSGQYQSYETTNFQIELNLEVQRAFGKEWQRQLRALPGEPIDRQTKAAIDEIVQQTSPLLFPFSRRTEARMQLEAGKELSGFGEYRGYNDLVFLDQFWDQDPQIALKEKRKFQEAIHAFETVMLLEPTNREARLYLAACLRKPVTADMDQALNLYREVINEPVEDKWTGIAHKALDRTFEWYGLDDRRRWYEAAIAQTTNPVALAFYKGEAKAVQTETEGRSGDAAQVEAYATRRLIEAVRGYGRTYHDTGMIGRSDFSMGEYLQTIGGDKTNATLKLARLLPRLEEVAPDMKAELVVSALQLQVDANTPVVAEFQAVLADTLAHPEAGKHPSQLWADIGDLYWWCLDQTNYSLAVQIMEAEQQIAGRPALHASFYDMNKIQLGYAYMGVKRWQDAVNIFDGFAGRPVEASGGGPWGDAFEPIFPDLQAAYCRKQLGLTVVPDPRRFHTGKPVLYLRPPSAFAADADGLWVGTGGQLLRLSFDLQTNLEIRLPMDPAVAISSVCQTPGSIWIGTRGAGLIEYDKASRQCRRLTEADGLMLNEIASLETGNDSLWIGYASANDGGLGRLDLVSRKLTSYMASLDAGVRQHKSEAPPQAGVGRIVAGKEGNLFLLAGSNLRQLDVAQGVWQTLPATNCNRVTCLSSDSAHRIEGGAIPFNDGGITRFRGEVSVQNLHDQSWQTLQDAAILPFPPSAATLDGENLWLGGEGYIALVDLKENRIKKFCHVQARGVDNIQIAGGYVWMQCEWYLYRVSLSTLE